MSNNAKLALAFLGAGVVGNLLVRGVAATAEAPPPGPPRGAQAMLALGLVGGATVLWLMRDDTLSGANSIRMQAAVATGFSGGGLWATTSIPTQQDRLPVSQQPAQLRSSA